MTAEDDRLFDEAATEFVRYCNALLAYKDKDVLPFGPHMLETIGRILFTHLRDGGYCTIALNGRTRWDPRSVYYEMCRLAARRGARIERDFLLPFRHLKTDPLLQQHVALDREAGITTNIRFVGDLLTNAALPPLESIEFGLWDERLACKSIYDHRSGQVAEFRLTRRAEDIQLLRTVATLLRSAPVIADTDQEHHLEEPMLTTAPVAHALAPVLCKGDYVANEDCSWYHGIWQYLRILNMVSTPTWHGTFYVDAVEAALNERAGKILISGAADYSTLAHVVWGRDKTNCADACAIEVLDLCETPLLLCRWYAKYVDTTVATVKADIVKLDAGDTYILIVTDAFLTRFDATQRRDVVKAWHRLLRSGGRVITTIRLEPDLRAHFAIASIDQADDFRARARRSSERWQEFLPIVPADLAYEAQRYAERMKSFSMHTAAEVEQLFTDAGFASVVITQTLVPGEMSTTTYAEVVAQKP
ncbi:MAG TPA: hypothetical protein VF911_21530 [Thermoanaerobaculia bacterium]|jgi:ubiquinone/menaquinone biosynthesis C-methylase UbiE